jgi:hypothetical protein
VSVTTVTISFDPAAGWNETDVESAGAPYNFATLPGSDAAPLGAGVAPPCDGKSARPGVGSAPTLVPLPDEPEGTELGLGEPGTGAAEPEAGTPVEPLAIGGGGGSVTVVDDKVEAAA